MPILSLTFVFFLLNLSLALAAPSSSCADISSLVPFLRAYSSSLSDHFYTTDVSEMNNNALAGGVYALEGDSAFLWSTPQPGTIPLFRLYNENSTDHFYTMSSDELPEMMDNGWAYDTAPNHTAGYVYPYSICGAAPIYRLFNPTIVDHFYTMDVAESQNAVKTGYQDQGIAGFAILPAANGNVVQSSAVPYLLPSAITASPESQVSAASSSDCANNANATPFLRAFSSTGKDHFYTTNSTEMNGVAIAQDAYSFEGDATFLWSTQETSTVPLYRLYSQTANDHFYTMDANETSEAIAAGYAFDTDSHIAGYVYPYSICGASPMYRLYSSASSDHFYTMSQAESQSASASGYILEGIAGFALLPSTDGQPQTATVSASPLLLPASLEPSAVSITSSSDSGFPTTIAVVPTTSFSSNPGSISTTSISGHSTNKAIPRSVVSLCGAFGVYMLVAARTTAIFSIF
ncbi:MAG: hypothetical protein NXY57DRAFT_1003491 [Lentinula lateritia]|nr:MAG: hypothetical protein NXY57DRAFT_1003491 [Lentinula lateritia]